MEIADYIVAEDRRLVELVLEGDDRAFEYLFNRYRDAIHRLFVQRLGGVNDADDLLQETFIKVYINLHRYSTVYTFGQWVYTIARNTFIDFVRRRLLIFLIILLTKCKAQATQKKLNKVKNCVKPLATVARVCTQASKRWNGFDCGVSGR